MPVNPFLGNRTGSLAGTYPTADAFCAAATFNSTEGGYCYSGDVYEPTFDGGNGTTDGGTAVTGPVTHHPLCLTRVTTNRVLSLHEYPGAPSTVVTHTQSGNFFLHDLRSWRPDENARLPPQSPWFSVSSLVRYSGELGMFSIAFHPEFASNRLFYISYTCDSREMPDTCPPAAECACVRPQCTSQSADLCRYVSVIAEYSAASTPPREVRQILRIGQPFANHNGGQVVFGPANSTALYVMFGDGGNAGDPYNLAQAPSSLMGKILKLDMSRAAEGAPYGTEDVFGEGWRAETWAAGLRNPWRCDWIPGQGETMMCGDVGQNRQEELTVVTAGTNHGWPFFEGTYRYRPQGPPPGADFVAPVFIYEHSDGPRSVTGGVFHPGRRDRCKAGAYLSADLYGGGFVTELDGEGIWQTQTVPLRCTDSGGGLPCPGSLRSIVGFGRAFGESFLLMDSGAYLVRDPSACGIELGEGCAARIGAQPTGTAVPTRPAGTATRTPTRIPTRTPGTTALPVESAAGPNLTPLWITLGALGGAALLGGAGYLLYRTTRRKEEPGAGEDAASQASSGYAWEEAAGPKPEMVAKV
ncbi:Sorbosone dehydrogenase-domain-containing protein [Hyaloraphidium curvatum]|nr:Sorbosone dehydrogenase-domain-containing protein [Hyaloraphidium curvatum]